MSSTLPVKKKKKTTLVQAEKKKFSATAINAKVGKVRRQRQDRAGIHISVSRCERIAKASWKGRVSCHRRLVFFTDYPLKR
jgi:hypothetical protein